MHRIAPSSTLENQAEPDLKVLQESIATWPAQREAYRMAGETEFLLQIIAPIGAAISAFECGAHAALK